ncbi:MAG: hypothetical protein JWO09_3497 [Bacteroidetes bacterium]|nr:hypothetical protein [Bacteroidota bacterium]
MDAAPVSEDDGVVEDEDEEGEEEDAAGAVEGVDVDAEDAVGAFFFDLQAVAAIAVTNSRTMYFFIEGGF